MQEGENEVDDKGYEVISGRTDFCACSLFHLAEKPPFKFDVLRNLISGRTQLVARIKKPKSSICF